MDDAARAKFRSFVQVLVNTLIANVTTSYLWFALTFWVYLETRSVLATAIIGGTYMLFVALFGIVFGVIVDHLRKKTVMLISAGVTLATYLLAGGVWMGVGAKGILDLGGVWFWVFSGVILLGGVVENLRNIALSTTVTLLVPADRRDRANGLVGTVQGIAFMVTSVFSGLSVGLLGMGWTLAIATVATAVATAHLLFVSIPEPRREAADAGAGAAADADTDADTDTAPTTGPVQLVDGTTLPAAPASPAGFRGILPAVLAVKGLMALILFTTFNNLVGGVFMALMDPYGLTLFPVEVWGIVLGVTSIGFIVGGGLVARFGLGRNPVRTLLLVNLGIAVLGGVFVIREWAWLYAAGMFVFMAIIPFAEAAEQTIIQRVVPFEKQGRVFGFAASVESASTPVAAFVIGPIAEFWLIPYMRTDAGQATFAWLLGEGEARGIALVFVLASVVMLITVSLAFLSRPYRTLSATYANAAPPAS